MLRPLAFPAYTAASELQPTTIMRVAVIVMLVLVARWACMPSCLPLLTVRQYLLRVALPAAACLLFPGEVCGCLPALLRGKEGAWSAMPSVLVCCLLPVHREGLFTP